jgi:glycosyltransferase involved in cell wall biosynthesis
MIRCTVGILAYNEAQNIRQSLYAVLAQELDEVVIGEIIVIASGCTDATVEIAESVARSFPLVTVDVELERTGKAAAIKRLLARATGEVIVMVGADTLPAPTAVECLVRPFSDRTIGMTGARVIPLNKPSTWQGFAVQMLWHVHHRLASRRPKLGELVAFRNVISDFPADTATDEPAIEALVAGRGYKLRYVPESVVYNRGPERTDEFIIQRRRIFAGQVRIAIRYRYFTSSLNVRYALPLVVEAIRSYPRFFVWTWAAIVVECWARCLGLADAVRRREPVVWRTAATTKAVAEGSDPDQLTLISVSWSAGTVNARSFLRALRRQSDTAGSVFWWDVSQREILLFVGGDSPLEWFEQRIEQVTREHVRLRPVYSNGSGRLRVSWVKPVFADRQLVSCRMVKFSSPALG